MLGDEQGTSVREFDKDNVVGSCDNGILTSVFVVINANDWNKIINAKLSFLRWFCLMNDAYVYRYAH